MVLCPTIAQITCAYSVGLANRCGEALTVRCKEVHPPLIKRGVKCSLVLYISINGSRGSDGDGWWRCGTILLWYVYALCPSLNTMSTGLLNQAAICIFFPPRYLFHLISPTRPKSVLSFLFLLQVMVYCLGTIQGWFWNFIGRDIDGLTICNGNQVS